MPAIERLVGSGERDAPTVDGGNCAFPDRFTPCQHVASNLRVRNRQIARKTTVRIRTDSSRPIGVGEGEQSDSRSAGDDGRSRRPTTESGTMPEGLGDVGRGERTQVAISFTADG